MADVKLIDVSKRFGNQVAVKNLSFEVPDGLFVCLLGPSGCGKTTTLRIIAGLERPDSGDIYIGGERVNDFPPHERDIAMVFQFYAIYPGMTVFDNLAFPLKQKKWSKNDIARRVKEVAEILQISHILDRDAMGLTVGEKQRVALGRALVRNPRVFLLDEPLTNLDARLRSKMRIELKRLHQRIKTTTIYVTHDQLEAMTLADKIGVMNFGELQQYDKPENLYNRPINLFVAGFVGTPTMNFVECKVHKKGDNTYIVAEGFTFSATSLNNRVKELPDGYELVIGIRPTDIIISSVETGAELKGKVEVVEPIGDKKILDISIGKTLLRVVVSRTSFIEGDSVSLHFDYDKIHIFDKKTGVRI